MKKVKIISLPAGKRFKFRVVHPDRRHHTVKSINTWRLAKQSPLAAANMASTHL